MANDRGEQRLPFRDVVKCDMRDAGGRQVWHSDGLVSEPVLVPASSDCAEDDGWLLVQMYHPREHRNEIAILDARHVDAGPVCRIELRHHYPFSFHCTFSPAVLGIAKHEQGEEDSVVAVWPERSAATASRPSTPLYARL